MGEKAQKMSLAPGSGWGGKGSPLAELGVKGGMLSLPQKDLWVPERLDRGRQGERRGGGLRTQELSSPATLRPLWIRTVGTEAGMVGEGRGPGCLLGGKGAREASNGPAEMPRGSLTSHPAYLGWKSRAKGTSGNSWGSVWGFAMATRPVSIGFGSPAWAWAQGPRQELTQGLGGPWVIQGAGPRALAVVQLATHGAVPGRAEVS